MHYYNENDPYAAEWLRRLIRQGELPAGHVDERSILEVVAPDLERYDQCHFFAGIGVWARAIRDAGYESARSLWTGSCPCQPFSQSGRRAGERDDRHLWPVFHDLIRECRPAVVLGEQVSGAAGLRWWDGVQDDLESSGYACGAVTFPAASVNAPHIRQRLYWMADALRPAGGGIDRQLPPAESRPVAEGGDGSEPRRSSLLADRDDDGREEGARLLRPQEPAVPAADGGGPFDLVEWIDCNDGQRRATQPGLCPLVNGSAAVLDPGGDLSLPTREGARHLVKGFGNALVLPQATVFVQAAMEAVR